MSRNSLLENGVSWLVFLDSSLCVNCFNSLGHMLYSKLDVNCSFLLLGFLVWLFPAYRIMLSL